MLASQHTAGPPLPAHALQNENAGKTGHTLHTFVTVARPRTLQWRNGLSNGTRKARIHSSASATTQSVARPSAIPHLEGKIRYIGVGHRGATILSRLVQHERLDQAHVWYIDHRENNLQEDFQNRIQVHQRVGLPELQVRRLIGPGACNQQGKGNINAGDGGIAFIIASADSVAGCEDLLTSLVQSLRDSGFFTIVTLSSPFHFEGSKKMQAAARVVAALESSAHLVSVIQQEKLIGLSTNDSSRLPMTVDDAVTISINAMEHTVRCLLAAVQAPEVLDSSKGALIWHGSEMRRFRRLLSPPLQQLLTTTSRSTLGRGAASMRADLASSMGTCRALMHLATDAVQAAIDSPFLEEVVAQASGALCCVSLPRGSDSGGERGVDHATARLAVQAAAGALMQMSRCTDIVMWYDLLRQEQEASLEAGQSSKEGATLDLEVSLLLLSPRGCKTAAAAFCSESANGVGIGSGTWKSQAVERQQTEVSDAWKAQTKGRLPASNWGLMSAMAGGLAPPYQRGGLATSSKETQKHISREDSLKARQGVITVSTEPAEQGIHSIGDQLAETFVSQSLDLPPKAAKWRQEQRARQERPRLMVQAPEAAWQPQDDEEDDRLASRLKTLLGGGQQAFDVRERTFAVLERDRGDAWESEGFP